jgi:hypothetical protein
MRNIIYIINPVSGIGSKASALAKISTNKSAGKKKDLQQFIEKKTAEKKNRIPGFSFRGKW